MSALDIEQAGQILRDYASAVIEEHENGGTVYELDYIVRLQKCLLPENGICGSAQNVTLLLGGQPARVRTYICELPAGHLGWHRSGDSDSQGVSHWADGADGAA